MTLSAIGPVRPVMFIFMACNTLCRRAGVHSILMALRTFEVRMFAHQREAGVVVVEGRVAPSARGMTGTAVRAELSVMGIFGCMTGITIRRCTFINTVDVAGGALNVGMFAGKREGRIIVIEVYIAPAACCVAGTAIRTKLPVMFILRSMTGITIGWRALIFSVDMARCALHIGMPSGKCKPGIAVIKADIRPFCGFMAGTAIRAELSVMFVLARMAGKTIGWRTLEHIIYVAGFARDTHMCAYQREPCHLAVVELGVFPLGRVMARRTDRTELTIVGIVCSVAREAFFRRSFVHAIFVACRTRCTCVRAGESETGHPAMIEVDILPGARVVAGGTVIAELTVMRII